MLPNIGWVGAVRFRPSGRQGKPSGVRRLLRRRALDLTGEADADEDG